MKKSDGKSKICIIQDELTIFDFLQKSLNLSKSQLKKSGIGKKYLEKKLLHGDIIELPSDILARNLINPNYIGQDIPIIFEDNDLVVINKPHNIHGHPLVYSDSYNVLSYLRKKYALNSLFYRSDNMERGLLYRLDAVTSGVLVFIKDGTISKNLRSNFHQKVKLKIYLALVKGKFDKDGEHIHHFSYVGKNSSKALVSGQTGNFEAKLDLSLVKYNKEMDTSLVKVILKTGLRHQIRAQISYLGFPIIGDTLYGGEVSDRVYLHAYYYSFYLDDKKRDFTVPMPDGLLSDLFDCDSIL